MRIEKDMRDLMTQVDKFIDELGINLQFFGIRLHSYASADARGDRKALPAHTSAAAIEGSKFAVKVALIARKTFVPERGNLIQSVLDVVNAYTLFIDLFGKTPSEHSILQEKFMDAKLLGPYLDARKTPANDAQRAARNFVGKFDTMFGYVTKALEVQSEKWFKVPLAKKMSFSLLASAVYFFQREVGKDSVLIKRLQYSQQMKSQIAVDYLRGPVIRILKNRSMDGGAIVRQVNTVSDKQAQEIVDDYFRRMVKSKGPIPLILNETE